MKELLSEHVTTGCCLRVTEKKRLDWGLVVRKKHKFSYNNRLESRSILTVVDVQLHRNTLISATVKKVAILHPLCFNSVKNVITFFF